MKKGTFSAAPGRLAVLPASLCCIVIGLSGQSLAQLPLVPALSSLSTPPQPKHGKHAAPEKPSAPPDLTIPVEPLGFTAPALFYLGDRRAQVSLNFLDEDSILFTFRVPGLIVRDTPNRGSVDSKDPAADFSPYVGNGDRHDERQIHALVFSLPSGNVTSEALWKLHDYRPYLWMLKDKRFLLRDRNTIQMGNSTLQLDTFLRFPGWVNYLELDPDQRFLVADTTEPVLSASKGATSPHPLIASTGDPPVASNGTTRGLDQIFGSETISTHENLLRILRMDDRGVALFSRVDGIKHLPLDHEGYYETLRGKGDLWLINYTDFHGGSTALGEVESICNPALDVLANGVVLASACSPGGWRRLTALTRNTETDLNPDHGKGKHRLWDVVIPPTKVWPLLVSCPEGRRIARATLDVARPVGINSPLELDEDGIRGQTVQVFDLATGKLELSVPTSPILDGGGNFALSPSGQRLAILNAGAIQIFNLPRAPDLPGQSPSKP